MVICVTVLLVTNVRALSFCCVAVIFSFHRDASISRCRLLDVAFLSYPPRKVL